MLRFDIRMDKNAVAALDRFNTRLMAILDKSVKDSAAFGKVQLAKSTARGATKKTFGGWHTIKLKEGIHRIYNVFKHAKFLETGTGLYGPLHRRITPVVAPFLVFPIFAKNKISGWVRTISTAGMPAQPMIEPNREKIQRDLNMRVRKNIKELWHSVFKGGK